MARYIDAERLRDSMLNYYQCVHESSIGRMYQGDTLMDYEVVDMIEDCIDNAPSADVVEVKCRCKDCKYFHSYGRTQIMIGGKNVKAGWCYLRAKTDEEHRMLPDDFCSYGERKEQ